nr:hypothetical protein [Tanacetum cinerariifolium]
ICLSQAVVQNRSAYDVGDNEDDSRKAKTAQAKEIASLKKRVKKLEQKRKSRTSWLKGLKKVGSARRVESSTEASLGDQEDTSKQGKMINNIDQDVEITLVDDTQRRMNKEDMFGVNNLDGGEVLYMCLPINILYLGSRPEMFNARSVDYRVDRFDYEIEYKKGKENVTADALLRVQQGQLFKMLIYANSNELIEAVKATWVTDLTLKAIIKGLGRMVKQQVHLCDVCQRNKSDLAASPRLLQPLKIPERVAQAFFDNIYKFHGLPSTIVSDRDKSDGQTEAVNKCLETYLRCMTGEKPKEWMKWLSLAEYWYNSSFYNSIKTAPFEVVYGQSAPIHIPYKPKDSTMNLVDRTLHARKQTIALLKFNLKATQDRMKSYADKKKLKRCHSEGATIETLPLCDAQGLIAASSLKLLDRKMVKQGNRDVVYGLV